MMHHDHTHTHTHTHAHTHTHTHTHAHTHTHTYIYHSLLKLTRQTLNMAVLISAHVSVCVCVHTMNGGMLRFENRFAKVLLQST